MNVYKKTFNITISTDLENLSNDFVESHKDNWLSNSNALPMDMYKESYVTPTNEEMTDSVKSEIVSWLNALDFEVDIKRGG